MYPSYSEDSLTLLRGGSLREWHRTTLFSPPFAASGTEDGSVYISSPSQPSFSPCFAQTLPPQTSPSGGHAAVPRAPSQN